MRSFMKKAVVLLVIFSLCLGGISYQKQDAQADESDFIDVLDTDLYDVEAGITYSRSFNMPSPGNLYFGIYTNEKASFTYTFANRSGATVFGPKYVSINDAEWHMTTTYEIPYYMIAVSVSGSGNYAITVNFDEDQDWVGLYGFYKPAAESTETPVPEESASSTYTQPPIQTQPPSQPQLPVTSKIPQRTMSPTATPTKAPSSKTAPSLDYKSLTITQGFQDKVSVVNTGGAQLTFTSSNNNVATVDSAGTVTAKKKGNATITVRTSTGYSLSCNVKVVGNIYSKKKTSVSKVSKGSFMVDVYKVSYDSAGNMILKTRLLNKSGSQVQYIKNFKITLKNGNGKTIGVYTVNKKTVNLKSGKAKTYTFKIKKSKLSIKKKQDLRLLSKTSASGDYYIKQKYVPKQSQTSSTQSSSSSNSTPEPKVVRSKKKIAVVAAH